MKRWIKNVIAFLIVVIAILSIAGTMMIAKNNLKSSSQGTDVKESGEVPSMPEGNGGGMSQGGSSDPSMGSNGSSTGGEVPEKPEGEDNSSDSNMSEPPEKPDGDDSTMGGNTNSDSNEPPEKPEGEENTTDSGDSSMQGGQMQGGQMPGGENSTISEDVELTIPYYVAFGVESFILTGCVAYLVMSGFNKKNFKETMATGDKVVIWILVTAILTAGCTFGEVMVSNKFVLNSNGNNSNDGNYMGGSSSSVTYSASKEITEDTTISSGEYTSTEADSNVINVSGDIDVTLSDITVSKTGDSDGGDSTSFYGNNSAIIAKDGANLIIKNATITTDATGANGVFSYGGSATTNNSSSDGTTVTISDSKITTSKDNSGGIMTTGGGVMIANNLEITTAGTSSAAIRTDRGGGTVTVTKGTYTTTGQGSPAVYSTADITVTSATLISKASEGIVIEGKNSVTIDDVDLTDSNTKLNGQSTTYKNIFLYQSMSGDADTGVAAFTAKNSKITTNNGDTFYVTNTTATISLENNTIINNDSDGNFLRVQKDSWGNSGSNGGDVTLSLTNQDANGNIVVDSISTLVMNLSDGSSYKGVINGSNEAKSITLKLDSDSKITLTGDSYVTSLDDEDSDYSNIDLNGYKLYVNGVALSK